MANETLGEHGSLEHSGTLTYSNGAGTVSIGPLERFEIDSEIIYDSADRVVSYVTHHCTVETYAIDPVSTDSDLRKVRHILYQPGGELTLDGLGFGDLVINGAGNARDANWGPKTRRVRFVPVGVATAAKLIWQFDTSLIECRDDGNDALQVNKTKDVIIEATYKVSYSHDASGYTTRTVSGTLRIPQTRKSPREFTLSDVADTHRDEITPRPIPGFRRAPWTFDTDATKNVLTFSITDTEMEPNVPPPFIIKVNANHMVSSVGPAVPGHVGPLRWRGRINGTYEVAKGVPRSYCAVAFFLLLSERLEQLQNVNVRNPRSIVPRSLQMDEPIYSRETATFNFVYEFSSTIENLISDSSLWLPIKDDTWEKWYGSLKQTAFHNRGNQKLALRPQDDVLHDPCTIVSVLTPRENPKEPTLKVEQKPKLSLKSPPKNQSWLNYSAKTALFVYSNTVEHKPLPSIELVPVLRSTIPTASTGLSERELIGGFFGGAIGSSAAREARANKIDTGAPHHAPQFGSNAPVGIIQVRGSPRIEFLIYGYARRAGFPIPAPELDEIDGIKLIPAHNPFKGDHFSSGVVDTWMGVPIYEATFQLRYVMSKSPANMVIPRLW